jgi:hypothetical protein
VRAAGREAAKQGESPLMAKMHLLICRTLTSQTSEHFLLEQKDVTFCM